MGRTRALSMASTLARMPGMVVENGTPCISASRRMENESTTSRLMLLEHRLAEVLVDAHHRAGTLHLRAEQGVHAAELTEAVGARRFVTETRHDTPPFPTQRHIPATCGASNKYLRQST